MAGDAELEAAARMASNKATSALSHAARRASNEATETVRPPPTSSRVSPRPTRSGRREGAHALTKLSARWAAAHAMRETRGCGSRAGSLHRVRWFGGAVANCPAALAANGAMMTRTVAAPKSSSPARKA